MAGSAASKKRKELSQARLSDLPDIEGDQARYFSDLEKYQPQSAQLARQIGEDDMSNALALRETAMPGIGGYLKNALSAAGPMAGGEFPQWLQDVWKSSAGANAFGTGFGGSPFGAGLTGWGSVDRAMGAQRQGVGLLGALMGMQPNVSGPSSGSFLSQLETPGMRTGIQMQKRGQNLGIASQLAQMDTSSDVWGNFLQQTGGMMAGAGMGAMGGGMGGGGAPSGNPTPGYLGTQDGAEYFNVPPPGGGGGWWSNLWGGGR